MVTITSNSERVDKILQELTSKIDDLSDVFQNYLKWYHDYIGKNFNNEGKYTNFRRWDELKEPYKSRKAADGYADKKILQRDGFLLNAVTGGAGFVSTITKKALQMKIDLIYATTMQYGDPERNISARPFLYTKDEKLTPTASVKLAVMISNEIKKGIN